MSDVSNTPDTDIYFGEMGNPERNPPTAGGELPAPLVTRVGVASHADNSASIDIDHTDSHTQLVKIARASHDAAFMPVDSSPPKTPEHRVRPIDIDDRSRSKPT